MVAGMLVASVGSGQLITKFGQWKPFIVAGAVLLLVGFGLLSTIDHATSLWTIGIFIAIVGLGTGMLMQNIVLAVQNTVSVENIGAASSIVAFFRTFGGAIGVSVLGSILATRVKTLTVDSVSTLPPEQQAVAGKSLQDGLDLSNMPDFVSQIVRFAYGDATGRIFLVAAVVARGHARVGRLHPEPSVAHHHRHGNPRRRAEVRRRTRREERGEEPHSLIRMPGWSTAGSVF